MMFEKAARVKLRFDSPAGQLSVEDLWDLPLTSATKRANLDDLAVHLDKELKETNTTSFVKKTTKGNEITKLKFDIVLRVIEVRQAENEAQEQKRINGERKHRLLELIAEKQDESLKGKSIDELQALVNSLPA
jgi:hypothetical protein